jgi:HSP20 family protein
MQEQFKLQHIPVKVYRTLERLMVTAPMPGLEPDNIVVEVTYDCHLILRGDMRGMLKEFKDLVLDEWSVGSYYRRIALSTPVDGPTANVSYGNGVLTVALPVSEQPHPARLTPERVSPARGQRKGHAGHPATYE